MAEKTYLPPMVSATSQTALANLEAAMADVGFRRLGRAVHEGL